MRRVAHGAFWAAASRWGLALISVASMIVMARILGPMAYGQFTLALVVVGVGGVIAGGPLAGYVMQRDRLESDDLHATFWLTSSLGVGFSLACALLARFAPESIRAVLPWIGVSATLLGLGATPFALLIRDMRFKAMAGIDLTAGLSASIVGVLLAHFGGGIYSLVVMELVRGVLRTAGAFVATRYRPSRPPAARRYGPIISFGLGGLGVAGLAYLDGRIPQIAIGAILGPQALGYYSLAARFLETIERALLKPLADVTFTAVARAQGDPILVRRLVLNIIKFSSFIATPAFVAVSAMAPIIVPTVFGARWAPAIATIQILLLVGVRSAAAGFSTSMLRALGRTREPLIIMTASVVSCGMLVPVLASVGTAAAALGVLLRYLMVLPLTAYFLKRMTSVSMTEQFGAAAPAQLAALIMGATLWSLTPYLAASVMAPGLTIFLGICFGGALYLAVVVAVDRKTVRSILSFGRLRLSRSSGDPAPAE